MTCSDEATVAEAETDELPSPDFELMKQLDDNLKIRSLSI
jgi:hypothetical protein